MGTTSEQTRNALAANAAFSLGTGLLLAIAPATVGGWLGVEVDGWLRLLGIALLGHAAMLAWAASQAETRKWAQLNLLAIAPYPVLMIGLVVTGLVSRPLGQGLVLADGVIVGAIAAMHWLGLRKAAPVVQAQAA